jgi:thioredoxin-dependent adenylylsulfate APS reductase
LASGLAADFALGSAGTDMHVTMVKKRLENGEPCNKCVQAEELLKRRGLWDRIDRVSWADEADPHSEGAELGARLGVELAPFFVVKDGDNGTERVYTSVVRFIQDLSAPKVPSAEPPPDASELARLAEAFRHSEPAEILGWGLERFGSSCAIAFSGAEDVVLIDMAHKSGLPFSIFSLDTGRLHPETYRFLEEVRSHYGVTIEVFHPDAVPLQNLVRKKGLFSFYTDGHQECCGIRKVEPTQRALQQCRAWVTGQRKDQSPTRSELDVIALDALHQGADGPLVKLNPLANWSLSKVWDYIRQHEVPHNDLHSRGYISIGCEPCTRAVRPGEHERAGRWWWEEATQRECGIHIGSPSKTGGPAKP